VDGDPGFDKEHLLLVIIAFSGVAVVAEVFRRIVLKNVRLNLVSNVCLDDRLFSGTVVGRRSSVVGVGRLNIRLCRVVVRQADKRCAFLIESGGSGLYLESEFLGTRIIRTFSGATSVARRRFVPASSGTEGTMSIWKWTSRSSRAW
jgi:hypothetical protein